MSVSIRLAGDLEGRRYTPKVHRVYKRIGAVSGPLALVGEVGHVPHQLVHDLGKLDGVSRGASTTTVGTRALTVGNMALVVGGIEVLAVPAPVSVLVEVKLWW